MGFTRISRISEEFKREISTVISSEIRDPRIARFTSVTAVEVTRDLRYAKVFISVLGDDKAREDTLAGLQSAAGFIRREMGKRVKLRYTPEIIFESDRSIERGIYMSKLIDKANEKGEDSE